MSGRYTRLFALPEELYSVGAPVVIAAGALQKDTQAGKVLVQLKLRNIQGKEIKALWVRVTPFDPAGEPLGGAVEHPYLDLAAGRDADFGQKEAVALQDETARSFTVSVTKAVFSDSSTWAGTDAPWEPLPKAVTLEEALADGELAKQYRLRFGETARYVYRREKDLWRCACGAWNREDEASCHACRREAAVLAAADVEKLKAERDNRVAAEKQQAAALKKAEEDKAKRTRKIAAIAVPAAIIAIAAVVLISGAMRKSNAYKDAMSLLEAEAYSEASAAFAALGDYKDSAEQAEEARLAGTYHQAMDLLSEDRDADAYQLLKELGNYRDAAEYVSKFVILPESMKTELSDTTYQYDARGRCIKEVYNRDGSIEETEYTYDESGNCVRRVRVDASSGDGRTTEYTYDDKGLCTAEKVFETVGHAAGDLRESYSYRYDASGNRVERVMDNISTKSHNVIRYTYNSAGQLVEERAEPVTPLDPVPGERYSTSSSVTRYTYDDAGNCVEERRDGHLEMPVKGGWYTSESSDVILREYDSHGNVTRQEYQLLDETGAVDPTKGSVRTSQYEYDEEGNLLSREDDNGDRTEYTYAYFYVPDTP